MVIIFGNMRSPFLLVENRLGVVEYKSNGIWSWTNVFVIKYKNGFFLEGITEWIALWNVIGED